MEAQTAALEAIGQLPDGEIDLADAALQLARADAADADWRQAADHLSELARDAARIGRVLGPAGLEVRVGALVGLLHARHAYDGDRETYDDLRNANLIRVIERRRGLPVALAILWLHCIRAAGWSGRALDVPGHVLVQIEGEAPARGPGAGQRPRLVLDAFANGAILGMSDIVRLVGRTGAAIAPGITRPMGSRDVLLRLQRNVTHRLRAAGRTEAALRTVARSLAIAPEASAQWHEAASLYREAGDTRRAIACLERFIALAPGGEAARGARARLSAWREGGE